MFNHDIPEGSSYVPGFNPITDALGPRAHAEMLRNAADKLDPPPPAPGEQFTVRRFMGATMLSAEVFGPMVPGEVYRCAPLDPGDEDRIIVEIVRMR